MAPVLTTDPAPSASAAVLIVLTLAAVPLRNRAPVPALGLTTAGATVVLLLLGVEAFATLAPVLALYTVAVRSDRRTTVRAWASTAAVLTVAAALEAAPEEFLREALPVVPWTAVAVALGDGLRNRRAYLAAMEERAVRAERSRDEEALRRVAEERVRIARELHDVVAHHIAVVNVQAGAAQHLLASQPAAAADALAHVRRAAGAVLEELGDILSVLRQPGESAESSAPAPGLARLEALIGSFTAAGLVVEWSLHGQPRELTPAVDLVAYRLIEEGLTNAVKHGTGSAHLSIDYDPPSLRLRVVNRVAAPVAASPGRGSPPVGAIGAGAGHGLLGMSERVAAVGGTLSATPTAADTFCVEAALPIRSAVRP